MYIYIYIYIRKPNEQMNLFRFSNAEKPELQSTETTECSFFVLVHT